MGDYNDKLDEIIAELSAIKRLLAHAMLQNGANQTDLATALGVNQSTVSRLFGGATKAGKNKKTSARAGRNNGRKVGSGGR